MATRDDRFNDLYAIVTEEYENWDEGRTVDWVKVEKAIANYTLTSYEEYRRITKGVKLNEVQKTLQMIYRCQGDQAIYRAEYPDTTIEELKESLVRSLETELEMNE